MLKHFLSGFFAALGALMVGVAIWFGAQSLDRPRLVWAGSAYASKEEFQLYLKSNGLSYRTWLRRHPGLAPWEPGEPASKSRRGGSRFRTIEILLAANAALLAALLALALGRSRTVGSRRQRPYAPHRQGGASRLGGVAVAGRHGIGHISRGATDLVHAATTRMRERPGSQEALIVYGVVLLLSVAGGVLVARYLGG